MPHALFLCLALLVVLAGCATESRQASLQQTADDGSPGANQPADPAAPSPVAPSDDATNQRRLVIDALTRSTSVSLASGLRPHTLDQVRTWLRAGQRRRVIDALAFSIDHYAEPEDRIAARYILGRLLTDDLDPAGLTHLEALPTPFEDFDDRRLVWLAHAQRLAGHDEAALTTLEQLLKDHSNINEIHTLRVTRADTLHRLGRTDDAIEALEAVAHSDAPEDLRAHALRTAADWLRADDPEHARRLEHTLLLRYPAEDPALEPGLSLTPDDLGDDERFLRARRLMDDWRYDEARDEFRRLVDHPRHGYDAAFNVGLISLRKVRDEVTEARAMFERVLAAKKGRHAEDALYYLLRTYLREENYAKGLELAERYDTLYPRGTYRTKMAYYRGWLPYDHRDCKAALPGLERYWQKRLGAERSTVMGFWAWCFVRQQDWQGAVEAFGKLADDYGNTVIRGKAWYWQAYALHQLGRDEDALAKLAALDQRYPLSYYAVLGWQLRAVIEGRDPTASKQPWPEGGGGADERFPVGEDIGAWDWPKLSGATERTFAQVRRLLELGEVDLARARYRSVRDAVEKRVPADKRKHFVLFMAHQVEDFNHPWKLAGGHLSQPATPDADDIDWALAYPEAYAPLIERLAGEHGVPAAFVYAIMRQESRYRTWQISGADAVGALQMIPKTARLVAADLGVEFDLRTFTRPEEGFLYSFFYMRNHLDTWKGQLVPTAASYNGGPEPIARWIRQNEGQPMAFLIEEFAYNESRIYCRKVTEHMLRYLYLYEDDAQRRGELLDALFPVAFDYDIPEDVGY